MRYAIILHALKLRTLSLSKSMTLIILATFKTSICGVWITYLRPNLVQTQTLRLKLSMSNDQFSDLQQSYLRPDLIQHSNPSLNHQRFCDQPSKSQGLSPVLAASTYRFLDARMKSNSAIPAREIFEANKLNMILHPISCSSLWILSHLVQNPKLTLNLSVFYDQLPVLLGCGLTFPNNCC